MQRLTPRAMRLALGAPVSTIAAPAVGVPQAVGVLAADTYFPQRYVCQTKLESADGVSAGKYTVGLGQRTMAVAADSEDIGSIALNAVTALMEKYNIQPHQVGRLEVGTESLVDKSKSIKTSLMPLFGGNTDIEGVTSINACAGGAAALFNTLAWCESSSWDGRYGIVVAGDVAVYEAGPARPTGGCGAFAVLVGPNAPLAAVPACRATHCEDAYDFYKPDLRSEYPVVDGKLSQVCYLRALDQCYNRHMDRLAKVYGVCGADGQPAVLRDVYDHMVFHSPYNKLVQQSFARVALNDARRLILADAPLPDFLKPLADGAARPLEDTYNDRDVMKAALKATSELYADMVGPTDTLSQHIGNSYTGAVFANLLSLMCNTGAELEGKRVGVFSYGSGAIAHMFGLDARRPMEGTQHATYAQLHGHAAADGARAEQEFTLQRIADTVQLHDRLAARTEVTPEEMAQDMLARERTYGQAGVVPEAADVPVQDGSWYLKGVNEKFMREYARK